MQGDFAGLGVEKITLREQVEVGGDLILTDARNLFCDQLLVDHLLSFEITFFNGVT